MRKEGKRKALAALVCGSMLTVAFAGGTMAYLTDTDSDVNVMTLGNVKIEQHEQQLGADGVTLEAFEQAQGLFPGTEISKIVTVENDGKSDAYFRTIVAAEAVTGSNTYNVELTFGENGYTVVKLGELVEIDGVSYQIYEAVYNNKLTAGETSVASLEAVAFAAACTNEDMEALGDTFEVLVLSQAVQTDGFADAKTALEAAFGSLTADNVKAWFTGDEFEIPTAVATADELAAALTAGESVYLTADINGFDADNTIAVAAGSEVQLNLNGHKLSAVADGTGNRDLFLVKGEMTVANGTIEMTATQNQGWNAMAAAFDVTAGGVLNLEGVYVKVAGTDMNFGVHLNNWGEVTLNANNCVFDASYCGVRVNNSGPDMNNVKITNSTLKGNTRAFWVHNYDSSDMGGKVYSGATAAYDKAAVDARLNLDIYGNGNTFEISGTAKSPIRYGFNVTTYYDVNGNVVE